MRGEVEFVCGIGSGVCGLMTLAHALALLSYNRISQDSKNNASKPPPSGLLKNEDIFQH